MSPAEDATPLNLTRGSKDSASKPRDPASGEKGSLARKFPLHVKILLGLVFGALLGGGLNAALGSGHPFLKFAATQVADPVGQLFLRLMLLMVIPLITSSLILAVTGMGDLRKLGRLGLRCFLMALVLSGVSVGLGITVANTFEPGRRLDPELADRLRTEYSQEAGKRVAAAPASTVADPAKAPLLSLVQAFVPSNIFSSMANNPPDMLGIMAFALLLGVVLALIPADKSRGVLSFAEGVYAAVSKAIELILLLAPYAVFCLLFSMTARFGFALLSSLGWFVAAVILGLSVQLFGVYSVVLAAVGRISPWTFLRRIQAAVWTAFSTSSSNATLPTALRVSEENLKIPRPVGSFVLTVGATANQNGTALFEGVTVLFLAQLAGVDLSLGAQFLVVYLAVLGGIGTAGVPAGSIPFIIAVLALVGVDPALIAIVLGVDRLLDMCRTVVNVAGDLVIAASLARPEGWKPDPELALG